MKELSHKERLAGGANEEMMRPFPDASETVACNNYGGQRSACRTSRAIFEAIMRVYTPDLSVLATC
jgi:hypothetical protein